MKLNSHLHKYETERICTDTLRSLFCEYPAKAVGDVCTNKSKSFEKQSVENQPN